MWGEHKIEYHWLDNNYPHTYTSSILNFVDNFEYSEKMTELYNIKNIIE